MEVLIKLGMVAIGTILLMAIEAYTQGNAFSLKANLRKYALTPAIMLVFALFLKEPVIQNLLLILGCIAIGYVIKFGIYKIHLPDTNNPSQSTNRAQIEYGVKVTMAESENKENTIMSIAAALLSVILFMVCNTMDTDLKLFAERAGTWPRVLGAILFLASALVVYIGAKKRWQSGAAILWLLFLAFAILTTCGFNLSYFGITN